MVCLKHCAWLRSTSLCNVGRGMLGTAVQHDAKLEYYKRRKDYAKQVEARNSNHLRKVCLCNFQNATIVQ